VEGWKKKIKVENFHRYFLLRTFVVLCSCCITHQISKGQLLVKKKKCFQIHETSDRTNIHNTSDRNCTNINNTSDRNGLLSTLYFAVRSFHRI
jgi:hypothetical protein